jgi:hypothetical protein
MDKMIRSRILTIGLLALTLSVSCTDLNDPPPASPTLVPQGQTQYEIAGRWDGITEQGRPIRFDVTTQEALGNPLYHANVIQGKITLHHDCSGGRLVLELTGYDTEVRGDTFSGTAIWRRDEPTKYYTGTLTVSGRFINGEVANGGFVNSVTDKYSDNLGVCGPSSGSWSARRVP